MTTSEDLDMAREFAEAVADDYNENLIPVVAPPLAEVLAAVARSLRREPSLAEDVALISPDHEGVLVVRLRNGSGRAGLQAWALLLEDPVSAAVRCQDHVCGEVSGRLKDCLVRFAAELPDDSVPDELGVHEWDVLAEEVPGDDS